jgi:hypothetical protein
VAAADAGEVVSKEQKKENPNRVNAAKDAKQCVNAAKDANAVNFQI